ncbi:MAG: chalcone isomerase [Bacteroidetes bacterium]|nr:MAG: chalcone isomerase [Bacteroidota bacterium]
MKKLGLFLCGFLFAASLFSQTKEVAGIKLPETLKVNDKTLHLKGAGIREKWFLDLYVGALYLPHDYPSAERIIAANETMAIKIHIISSLITSDKMISATKEGFEKSTKGNTQPLQDRIDQFIKAFSDPIELDDDFEIVYIPGEGTYIYKNGQKKELIKGIDFKRALFGIWLGEEPADEDLKEAMLGEE